MDRLFLFQSKLFSFSFCENQLFFVTIMERSIKTLMPRHFKILDYLIDGWTAKMIGEKLGMGQSQLSVVINSPSFKHQLAMRRQLYEETKAEKQVEEEDGVMDILKKSARDAANKLKMSIKSTDEKIAVRASSEILDRAGYGKVINSGPANQNIGPVLILSGKDANRIIETIELDNPRETQAEDNQTEHCLGVDNSAPNTPQPVLSVVEN